VYSVREKDKANNGAKSNKLYYSVKVKVKQSLYKPGMAQRVPGS